MELLILLSKIIFGVGLIFVAIYGALGVVVLWRFSLSRTFALSLSVSFIVLSLIILGHAFYALANL